MNAYNALKRPLLRTVFLVMVLVTGAAVLAFDKAPTQEATPLSNPTLEQTQESPEPTIAAPFADKNGKVRAPRSSSARSRASSSSRPRSSSRASSGRSSSTRRADSGRSRASNSGKRSTYVARDRKGVVRGTRNHGSANRPGRGHGSHRGHYYGGYGGYYGYGRYGYFPSYLGWGLFPWSWYYSWSFNMSPHYFGYYSYNDNGATAGALDLNVKPKRTKIYLNGRYIGKADQFDGFPGYLWVREGNHELIFYLDGHETIRKEYAVARGSLQRDRFYMDQGEPTPPENLSMAKLPVTVKKEMKHSDRATAQRRFNYAKPQKPELLVAPKLSEEEDLDLRTEPGRLRFTIEPTDASIYLDGNFLGTAADLRNREGDFLVDLGDHILEIVRPGYASKKLAFVVKKGETINLTQSLEKE